MKSNLKKNDKQIFNINNNNDNNNNKDDNDSNNNNNKVTIK